MCQRGMCRDLRIGEVKMVEMVESFTHSDEKGPSESVDT